MHASLPAARREIERWANRHAKRVATTMEDPDDLTAFNEAYRRHWPA
jgi:hypothetical protein